MRIPRKKKKKIPVGLYCYEFKSEFKRFKDGSYGYEIKPFKFYSKGTCRLIGSEIMDQCKSCGTKYGF